MDIQRMNAAKSRSVDSEWMKSMAKEGTVIEEDRKKEESIIIYAIKSLGSIKDRSPAEIQEMIEKGKSEMNIQQVCDAVINIIKKIREALTLLRNDEETLITLYRQIPYSIEKRIGDEKILRQIRNEVKEITQRLDDYRIYWEDNKKENKVTGGFFSDNKKRRIQDSFLKILNEDDKINKEMLRVVSDVYTKQSMTSWH